jgi:hypothetical protein
MENKMCCGCCSKTGVLFKLSLMGVLAALLLMLSGLFYPFNRILVPFPLSWVLALFVIIPSITLYFNVKERFWAEVADLESKKKEK